MVSRAKGTRQSDGRNIIDEIAADDPGPSSRATLLRADRNRPISRTSNPIRGVKDHFSCRGQAS